MITKNSRNASSFHSKQRQPRKKQVSSLNPEDLIRQAEEIVASAVKETGLFEDMPLHAKLKANIEAKGFVHPTQIQEQTIEKLIDGNNLVGIANTGTGKTGAFLIPIIEQMLRGDVNMQSLIVLPTRELALQVEEEFKSISQGLGIYSATFIGGTNVDKDVSKAKRKNHLIIGTPGRLLDLMNQRALNIMKTEVLVLDEFDKMLDMGFIRDIEKIVQAMRNRRQTMLFSATVDKKQAHLIEKMVSNPIKVSVNSGLSSSERVNQDIIRVGSGDDKFKLLTNLLSGNDFEKILIFTETKHLANRLAKQLNQAGISSDQIHGNKSQNYRIKALDKFKSGKIKVLVATDVAARGIDVENVSHVINYQLPMNWDSYVHRIGRTGRAGKTGQAYTFVD